MQAFWRQSHRHRRETALPPQLAGVNDPEEKRKIIGREFVEVF
jgi:GMP synthase PP-ATPase subunit